MRSFDKNAKKSEYEEKVIQVNRVCRTMKGGRRMSFRALVAIGNKHGKVGVGLGKSSEVLLAVKKAIADAKKNLIEINVIKGTIPHEINIHYGSAHLFMKPASQGTSIIAGGAVRAVVELAGIKDILTKIIGSSNKINNAQATILALKNMYTTRESQLEKEKSDKNNG